MDTVDTMGGRRSGARGWAARLLKPGKRRPGAWLTTQAMPPAHHALL